MENTELLEVCNKIRIDDFTNIIKGLIPSTDQKGECNQKLTGILLDQNMIIASNNRILSWAEIPDLKINEFVISQNYLKQLPEFKHYAALSMINNDTLHIANFNFYLDVINDYIDNPFPLRYKNLIDEYDYSDDAQSAVLMKKDFTDLLKAVKPIAKLDNYLIRIIFNSNNLKIMHRNGINQKNKFCLKIDATIYNLKKSEKEIKINIDYLLRALENFKDSTLLMIRVSGDQPILIKDFGRGSLICQYKY